MKIFIQLFLFFLIIAFAAPSVINFLDSDEEISLTNSDENEKFKDVKELKVEFVIFDSNLHLVTYKIFSKGILTIYLVKDYLKFTSINIEPPMV